MQSILSKVYDLESVNDVERDVYEAITDADIRSENGSFKVEIVFDYDRETEEDWEE